MADPKFFRLRSGVVMPYTRTVPTGAVACDAAGNPLGDEPVKVADGQTKPIPAALLKQELTETVQPGELPDGPALAVIEWVGNDPQRAATALEAENNRVRPRGNVLTAISHLTEPTEGA